MTTKIVYGKKEELEKEIANIISNKLLTIKKPKLILPTGNSPIGVYNELVEKFNKKEISFKNTTTFNLDEYLEKEKYEDVSFEKFMNENLFKFVNIKKNKINFPSDPGSYDRKLDKVSSFDFALLGVGVNGHIAFNEPGTEFNSRTHEVELTNSTIKANFKGMDIYPKNAITMGIKDIFERSDEIIIMAWGDSKREAIKSFLKNSVDSNWPITYFIKHKNIKIYTNIKI